MKDGEPSSGLHGNIKRKYATGDKVPDAVKKLRGTYRKKNADLAARKVGANDASELMLPVDVPEYMYQCPDTLTNEISRQEWGLYIIPLIKADVIKLTDLRMAEIYCDLWGSYQDLKKKYGFPPIKVAEPLIRIMTQMGLTPVSRHKVVRIMRGGREPTGEDWKRILNQDDDEDDNDA